MWDEQLVKNVESELREQGELRIDVEGKTFTTLKDFLLNFFSIYNHKYETYNLSGEWQCNSQCNRSIGDIYRISLLLFPNLTLKELYKALYDPSWFKFGEIYTPDGEITSVFCGDIQKRIYNIGPHKRYGTPQKNNVKPDEFGITIMDVCEMLNL